MTLAFLEQVLAFAVCPNGFDNQLAAGLAALGRDDALLVDRAHLGCVFGLDGVGVVPEIEAIDIAVVEPQARMMRMIDTLSRSRRKRIAARNRDAARRDQRIECRLLERCRPNVGGEGLAIEGNIDAPFRLVGSYLHSLACRACQAGNGHAKNQGGTQQCPPTLSV